MVGELVRHKKEWKKTIRNKKINKPSQGIDSESNLFENDTSNLIGKSEFCSESILDNSDFSSFSIFEIQVAIFTLADKSNSNKEISKFPWSWNQTKNWNNYSK